MLSSNAYTAGSALQHVYHEPFREFQELAACDLDRYADGDHYLRYGEHGILRCRIQDRDDDEPCCRRGKLDIFEVWRISVKNYDIR